jgi:DNA repair protein SbcD/Mre11
MKPAVRLLHTADSHIGADLPVRGTGRQPRRGNDFVESFRLVLSRARAYEADLVIHAGDLFNRSEPRAGAVAAATEPLWQLAESGIPVVIVPGNHERSSLPGLLLLSHPNIHVVQQPCAVVLESNGMRVAIVGVPCVRRAAAGQFGAVVQEVGWDTNQAEINILAAHQIFEGTRCGPSNYCFRTGEDVVPREAIPPGFDYIAAGHIHRHQTLGGVTEDSPPIVYSGSPDRITFAEIGEPKGCVVVDFADGRVEHRFIEHDVRPTQVVPFDVSGLSGKAVGDRLLATVENLPSNALTQVRLTGQATRRDLAGLKLNQRLRELRPDGLTTISFQAVEWISERAAFQKTRPRARSAFDLLDAPPKPILTCAAADVGGLPAASGTYALYDADGRLLYIGKAGSLRTRIRTHVRTPRAGNHFLGWTRQIHRIEARTAASDLEAALVEAELIRRLAPPFNRQMRLWKRYCYLCPTALPYGQLDIRSEPSGRHAFGPLRSRTQAEAFLEAMTAYLRIAHCPPTSDEDQPPSSAAGSAQVCHRYFAGQCTGPCAGRIVPGEYEATLRRRDALLAADEAAWLEHLDEELAAAAPAEPDPLFDHLQMLCQRAILLRDAGRLLNAPILLPGDADSQPSTANAHTVALVTLRGLHLRQVELASSGAAEVQKWLDERIVKPRDGWRLALPKPVADVLCTAALHLRRSPGRYTVLDVHDFRARANPPHGLNTAEQHERQVENPPKSGKTFLGVKERRL